MSSNNSTLQNLLQNNVKWAQAVREADPDFFERSSKGQSPQVLWIGCADSRVPESVVTASKPGEIFVHRNIANQVHLDDDSVLSVVAYAVDMLKVKHVIVVGHSSCGGADACVTAARAPPPDAPPSTSLHRWLTPLANLARSLGVDKLEQPEALSLLVKENVNQQVQNLVKTETIKGAWARGDDVQIHGWVYNLSDGTLNDLGVTQAPGL